MLDSLFQIIAPHHCCSCGEIGRLLCDNCKYDIISEPFAGCLVCRRAEPRGICVDCKVPYEAAWCAGERDEALRQLLDRVKFDHATSGIRELVDVLDAVVSELPDETIVAPIPTVASHVRRRGHAHVERIARDFARRRNITFERVLMRHHNKIQRGANRAERLAQARSAFRVHSPLSADHPWLLIDDVVTTGATMHWAAQALREAGAKRVFVAAIARQPLDNDGSHLLKYPEKLER